MERRDTSPGRADLGGHVEVAGLLGARTVPPACVCRRGVGLALEHRSLGLPASLGPRAVLDVVAEGAEEAVVVAAGTFVLVRLAGAPGALDCGQTRVDDPRHSHLVLGRDVLDSLHHLHVPGEAIPH